MTFSNLIRWGGLAFMVGALLLVVGIFLPEAVLGGAPSSLYGYLTAVLSGLAQLLLSVGLVGLHARQRLAGGYGRLGAAGFSLAFVRSLLGAVLSPVLGLPGPLQAAGGIASAAWIVFGAAGWLGMLGLLLLGVATLRARVLPLPWRALPLAIVAVYVLSGLLPLALALLLGIPPGSFAFVVPGVLIGLGWALLGYALWSGKGKGVRRRRRPAATR